jgi:hypothetical protein
MDDRLMEIASNKVIKYPRFGGGDNEKAKELYKISSNDCKDLTDAIFEEYKSLWMEEQEELNEDNENFDVDEEWEEHLEEITADAGDTVEYTSIDKNQVPESQDDSSEGTIICTELYKQGLMDAWIYEADSQFGEYLKNNRPEVMAGYHYLARPIVSLMRKSRYFTYLVNFFAKPWSYEMSYRVGAREKGDFTGSVVMFVGIPICSFTGKLITGVIDGKLILLYIFGLFGIYFILQVYVIRDRNNFRMKTRNALFIMLVLASSVGCSSLKEEDKSKIIEMIEVFYNQRTELQKQELERFYYHGICDFYIQDNKEHKGFYSDNIEKLMDFFSNSVKDNGIFIEYDILEISYPNSIYDVPESKLFFAKFKVKYEKRETIESFMLKKEGADFKIYRYTVEYN